MWESVFQIAGLIAGVAGAYFAYRQYRLARNQTISGEAGLPVGTTTARFQAAPHATEKNMFLLVGTALTCFFFALPLLGYEAKKPNGEYLPLVLSGITAAATTAVYEILSKPRWIGVDDAGVVVYLYRSPFRPAVPVRFAWSDTEAVAVAEDNGKRQLLLRMGSRYGVGTTEQQRLWNDGLKAFKLCDLSDVKPSEPALLASIYHYSGGLYGAEPEAGRGG